MTFDTRLFAQKLVRCSEHFGLDVTGLSAATGIAAERVAALREGSTEPTGDEVLIFADVFKIDFKFFVSADAKTPFDQIDVLYRKFGDQVSVEDRRAVAELLYLCDTEQFLLDALGRATRTTFSFEKTGDFFKRHGEDAARALRAHLGLEDRALIGDVFAVARRLGVHVFRRRLRNPAISGLTVRHPGAGPCVLVNVDEDRYRQRFTLAHELGHVFLDDEEDVVVSFTRWEPGDLKEIRANAFAGHLLVPQAALHALRGRAFDDAAFIALAHRLAVNAQTLARALGDAGAITADEKDHFGRIRLPRVEKDDPELSPTLTEQQRRRKLSMLDRGLSQAYVELCLDAYDAEQISRGRLAEALLASEDAVADIAALYGRRLAHA